MKRDDACRTIEEAAAAELDQIIAKDKAVGRIRKPDTLKWLWLNGLRLALARLSETELAELARLSGAGFPGPAP
jgi:hypothetical protein